MRTTPARRFVALAVLAASVSVTGAANAADTDTPASTASTPTTVAGASATTKAATAATPSTTATGSAAPASVDHMAIGRAAVAKTDWKLAVAEFTAAVDANAKNADAKNMLAYSYRKSGDLTNAFKYYKVALTIDPKHKGALEYQGEAYVMAGKMKDAKANLAKLKAAGCGTTCENYKDLAAFIAKPPAKKK
jgi:Flp pilus assembly protein TadD